MVAKGFSKKMKIDFKNFKIDVEGEINKEVSRGFCKIKTTYHIDGDITEDQLSRLIDLTERYCPVKITMIDSPEFESEVILNGNSK